MVTQVFAAWGNNYDFPKLPFLELSYHHKNHVCRSLETHPSPLGADEKSIHSTGKYSHNVLSLGNASLIAHGSCTTAFRWQWNVICKQMLSWELSHYSLPWQWETMYLCHTSTKGQWKPSHLKTLCCSKPNSWIWMKPSNVIRNRKEGSELQQGDRGGFLLGNPKEGIGLGVGSERD